MITRLWRGWTTPENAQAYESLLLNDVFPSIVSRGISGYRGISLARRNLDREVEFITIMWFDSIVDVRRFSGDDYETAVVPAKARAMLLRFDERSAHFETVVPPPEMRGPMSSVCGM